MSLPLKIDYPPMEAKSALAIPEGTQWQYEPKWDGFRCLAFRDGDRIEIQSKSGQSLGRYFPEVVAALASLAAKKFVLDGEIIVPIGKNLSFDDLLQRIHPAATRVAKLARETPASLVVFDLLVDEQRSFPGGRTAPQSPREAREFRRKLFHRIDLSLARDSEIQHRAKVVSDHGRRPGRHYRQAE
jgi:ATP-dependent DNA ligase